MAAGSATLLQKLFGLAHLVGLDQSAELGRVFAGRGLASIAERRNNDPRFLFKLKFNVWRPIMTGRTVAVDYTDRPLLMAAFGQRGEASFQPFTRHRPASVTLSTSL